MSPGPACLQISFEEFKAHYNEIRDRHLVTEREAAAKPRGGSGAHGGAHHVHVRSGVRSCVHLFSGRSTAHSGVFSGEFSGAHSGVFSGVHAGMHSGAHNVHAMCSYERRETVGAAPSAEFMPSEAAGSWGATSGAGSFFAR